MKKKNKAKKSITAVGAVVAAGLTPGIVTGAPAPQAPSTDIELTAADVISINGDVFDFDELFAMHQVNQDHRQKVVYGPPQPKVYGPVPPKNKDKDKVKNKDKDKKNKEQEIADSLRLEEIKRAEELERDREHQERLRQEAIQRDIERNHKLVYGPPPVDIQRGPDTEFQRLEVVSKDKQRAITDVEIHIIEYIHFNLLSQRYKLGDVNPDSNLERDLEIPPMRLRSLINDIDRNYGVQLTEEMLKQLNTPHRLAKFIVEVITPINE